MDERESEKMKNKGFTLIELLAVITIMGILMLVAIPAVSRTIENSRRDTFADIAHNYINAVRNAVLADNIQCYINGREDGKEAVNASATTDGTYYFLIDTKDNVDAMKDLMESGGKSPFGNAEMKGYVKWVKSTEYEDDNKNNNNNNEANGSEPAEKSAKKTTTKYSMLLVDSGSHGFDKELAEAQIKRAKISTKTTKSADEALEELKKAKPIECELS